MGIISDRTLDQVNSDLDQFEIAQFSVANTRGGKPWATATISISKDGGHKLDMTVQAKGRIGTGFIYRQGYSDLTAEQVWATFGTAYERATASVSDTQVTAAIRSLLEDQDIDIDDFVVAHDLISGVVVDILESRRSETVSYTIVNSDGEMTYAAEYVRLVAKAA